VSWIDPAIESQEQQHISSLELEGEHIRWPLPTAASDAGPMTISGQVRWQGVQTPAANRWLELSEARIERGSTSGDMSFELSLGDGPRSGLRTRGRVTHDGLALLMEGVPKLRLRVERVSLGLREAHWPIALGRAIVGSLRQALVTAVVVITLLLMLPWRSVRYTLITLTPLFVDSVMTAAVSVVFDIPFNFANVIVLPLILGIGVDSGIHLVHRHRRGLLGAQDLLATSTANAVFFSALTTIASFSSLAFSHHLGISSLGQMLSVGIASMLAANVVVLPAILTLVDPKQVTTRLDAQ